ncbi:hypothetical protein E1A91_D01G096600v1 [Gossypium mustelinum]|uniref:Uncharacterized protein n=1 Tax=Gossypium mustelinum TaxID=34275 RepID=A0A5D2W4N2_GOSMU|nr:hypothetical protein E1A91_D01G096600v1 [Gossypium mustelinum]
MTAKGPPSMRSRGDSRSYNGFVFSLYRVMVADTWVAAIGERRRWLGDVRGGWRLWADLDAGHLGFPLAEFFFSFGLGFSLG